MPVDRIPQKALHARFKEKGNEGTQGLGQIDDLNEDITWTNTGNGLNK